MSHNHMIDPEQPRLAETVKYLRQIVREKKEKKITQTKTSKSASPSLLEILIKEIKRKYLNHQMTVILIMQLLQS